LIELNARPGLSTNLIYKIHKDIYKNTDNSEKLNKNQYFYGTQIIYSKKDLLINNNRFKLFENLKNSSTFSELPLKDIIIKKNEPICLIHLKSKKTVTLKKNLKNLSNKILNNLD
jgi:predicted ATP-grasp superfamily ATP-dependent carboligase